METLLQAIGNCSSGEELVLLVNKMIAMIIPSSSSKSVNVAAQKSALQFGVVCTLLEKLKEPFTLLEKQTLLKGLTTTLRDPTPTERSEGPKQNAMESGLLQIVTPLMANFETSSEAITAVSWACRWSRERKRAVLNVCVCVSI